MSPRLGGEADKFGNRYEGAWTVRQLLRVLAGRVTAVTVEPLGELGDGAEFVLERRQATEAHQVKRQRGMANEWSLPELKAAGVLESASKHVAAGREFHFVSLIPARDLDELADRARRSDLASFLAHMRTNDDLRSGFDYLSGDKAYGSPEAAWTALRGTWARWPDERDVREQNAVLADLLLEGASGPAAAAVLAELVLDHLGERLDASTLEGLLDHYGLRRAQLIGSATLAEQVTSLSDAWKATVDLELLSPSIPRAEAGEIVSRFTGPARVVLAVGTAGGGKSATLRQTVEAVEAKGWPVLALRLDRLGSIASTLDLGQNLGLGVSPVTALAATNPERPSLLVIDQLDAVSLASGRMPENFDFVGALLREARAFPEMRVLLACRQFDVDNDHRIRAVAEARSTSKVEVQPLNDEQVDGALQSVGLRPSGLSQQQRGLLRSPLNLVLLASIADEDDALSFGSTRDLLDAFWDRKFRDCRRRRQPPPRFTDVIRAVADAMSSRRRLAVPVSVLDDSLLDDADILASEHVLVRDGRQLAFFHETFFDYAFARQWVDHNETVVDFLLAEDQELFRRAQVRQILTHIREDDPERFVREAEGLLLHPEIRFHIKHVVLAVLRAQSAPTSAEWEMIKRVATTQPAYGDQLRLAVRTVPWFERIDADGDIAGWLAGTDAEDHGRAMDVMMGAVKQRPDRIAELLAPHAGHQANYSNWLRWMVRFADVHRSRPLFDLLLDSVRRGEYQNPDAELWPSVYGLADHQPAWAVELIAVYLGDQPGALDPDSSGRLPALLVREHAVIDLVSKAAAAAPSAYCDSLLPYLSRAMALTERDTGRRPIEDWHFSYGSPPGQYGPHELEDALFRGAAGALRALVRKDAEATRPRLESLAADEHEGAQWLLYEALRTGGASYAEWAGALLLEGDHRFFSGYSGNRVWAARQLIQAVSPHLSAEVFTRLEQAILDLRVSWETRQSGWCQFCLLSALNEGRLSAPAQRRLGELRRLFGSDQPAEPEGITGGFIGAPVPESVAQRMTDDQWLGAMARYNTERTNWTTFTGGAHEQASVLQSATARDPARFGRLALRLSTEMHPAYGSAILQGLAKTPTDPDIVFAAIRHLAALGVAEHDHWLAYPLTLYLDAAVPDDIIELVLDRALHSPDPTEDVWLKPSSNGDPYYGGDIYANGINTGRGTCAEMLGDLLVYDADGHRTALVTPALERLASDKSVAVRACAAHVLTASLRHARPEAARAFELLVQADDRLLATRRVADLVVYVGKGDPALVEPVIQRMLASTFDDVKRMGGQLATFAGLELGFGDLLAAARGSEDEAIRTGVAEVAAARLPHTSNAQVAGEVLIQVLDDANAKVREAAGGVAVALRTQRLRPFTAVLDALMASEAFRGAVPQLLITLAQAPDRIDSLIVSCARRFVSVFGIEAGDLRTGAAGDAKEVAELLLRAYVQANEPVARDEVLDLIDELLLLGAYGVDDAVDAARR